MTNFRPTLIERAYQLADGGTCSKAGEVKRQLVAEGFASTSVLVELHGQTIANDLMRRCRANFRGEGTLGRPDLAISLAEPGR